MCLTTDQFYQFLTMLDPGLIDPAAAGHFILGEAKTHWLWVNDIARWCIDGVWK